MGLVNETVFAFNSEYNLGKDTAKTLMPFCRPSVEKYIFSKVSEQCCFDNYSWCSFTINCSRCIWLKTRVKTRFFRTGKRKSGLSSPRTSWSISASTKGSFLSRAKLRNISHPKRSQFWNSKICNWQHIRNNKCSPRGNWKKRSRRINLTMETWAHTLKATGLISTALWVVL